MKKVTINKTHWEKAKKKILAETPGYPEYAAENAAAKQILGAENAKLFGGDKEKGWVFTLHKKASPENVLAHLSAKRFPITLDNVQYTVQNNTVYSHASGGNMSRRLWAKGKKVETLIICRVLVNLSA